MIFSINNMTVFKINDAQQPYVTLPKLINYLNDKKHCPTCFYFSRFSYNILTVMIMYLY